MERDSILALLRENPIFKNLTLSHLTQFLDSCQKKHFNPGDYLIHEGEIGKHFFILLDGKIAFTKKNPENQQELPIFTLSEMQLIGEMSWLDEEPRSVSARALTSVEVLQVDYADMDNLIKKIPEFYSIFRYITKNLSLNLRKANDIVVKTMIKHLAEYKIRNMMGVFSGYAIIMLSFYSFLLYGLNSFFHSVSSTTFIGVPIGIFFLISFIIFVKCTNMPWRFFGITTDGWKKAMFEGIVFTIPIILFLPIFKLILIATVPSYQSRMLFEPYTDLNLLNLDNGHIKITWMISVMLYIFISVPLQELIVRGGCQSPLQEFLVSKYKNIIAIVISNLIFETQHLIISFRYALLALIPGFYFGWLYSRHHTLIGVILAHILLGFFGTWVIGF
jgi:hypothetical protein